jgi:hypothetical protein
MESRSKQVDGRKVGYTSLVEKAWRYKGELAKLFRVNFLRLKKERNHEARS